MEQDRDIFDKETGGFMLMDSRNAEELSDFMWNWYMCHYIAQENDVFAQEIFQCAYAQGFLGEDCE